MGAITPKPEKLYSFDGFVRMRRWNMNQPAEMEYIVCWSRNEDAAVMLEVKEKLAQYLEELYSGHYQEERMTKRFHYNHWCELQAVDVLDDGGNVVKTVEQGGGWLPFIGEELEAENGAGNTTV